MKRSTRLTIYLLLNVLISAATTLAVLVAWDFAHRGQQPVAVLVNTPVRLSQPVVIPPTPAAQLSGPTDTPLPASAQVIQILSVVGAGDLEQEMVMIRRVGSGNLNMAGWKLQGENNNTYAFPSQPELVLYKDGAVQVHSKVGADTATDVYWNRSAAAWRSGETLRLVDGQGNERASYRVP